MRRVLAASLTITTTNLGRASSEKPLLTLTRRAGKKPLDIGLAGRSGASFGKMLAPDVEPRWPDVFFRSDQCDALLL